MMTIMGELAEKTPRDGHLLGVLLLLLMFHNTKKNQMLKKEHVQSLLTLLRQMSKYPLNVSIDSKPFSLMRVKCVMI